MGHFAHKYILTNLCKIRKSSGFARNDWSYSDIFDTPGLSILGFYNWPQRKQSKEASKAWHCLVLVEGEGKLPSKAGPISISVWISSFNWCLNISYAAISKNYFCRKNKSFRCGGAFELIFKHSLFNSWIQQCPTKEHGHSNAHYFRHSFKLYWIKMNARERH